jgi:tRNA(Ile)-lysidine synthase
MPRVRLMPNSTPNFPMPLRASKRVRNRSASASDAREVAETHANDALTEADLDKIGDLLLGGPSDPQLIIAVSGGADSMALLHVCVELQRRRGKGEILAVTIDHGLRPGSAQEAVFVANEAKKINVSHLTLTWDGAKPSTGIQSAARVARYQLLSNVFHRSLRPQKTLLTAHTLDDQAETFIMRLMRGSGVDGLAGISTAELFSFEPDPSSQPELPDGLVRKFGPMFVVRPFLEIPKSRLVSTLRAWGKEWCEDPSNQNDQFERVRVRRSLEVLTSLGLTAEAVARSAKRIASTRDAVRNAAHRTLNSPKIIHFDALGFAVINKSIWTSSQERLDEAIIVRVLAGTIRIVGGNTKPISLKSLENVARKLNAIWYSSDGELGLTIDGTIIRRNNDAIIVCREEGRRPPPELSLMPGQSRIWDGRFHVSVGSRANSAYDVRMLGSDGLKVLRELGATPSNVAAEILKTIPSFWVGNELVAAPALERHWRSAKRDGKPAIVEELSRNSTSTFQATPELLAMLEVEDEG